MLVLAVGVEEFGEMLATDGSLDEVAIQILKDIDQRPVGLFLYTVEDLLVALLGYDALLGISIAVAEAEQLLDIMAVRVIPAISVPLQSTNAEQNNSKIRVGAYCRVSTDHEDQETSYESQVKHYREYIQAHPDWVLADIYADEGLSGTSATRRESFQRMIKDCENHKLDMILTKSISRFARNTLDCLNYIRKLKSLGIPIVFEKESINTMDERGELLISIMASIAQQESQSISQNVRLGIQYNFQRGKPKLNYSRFLGYTKGPRDDMLTIVPEEADIVRSIFRDFLEGMTIPEICNALQKDGIRAPGGKGKWYPSTVESMLQNEKFQGDLLLQKTYTVDFLTKERAFNHGRLPQYYVENAHEPILPRDVFQIAQGEMLRRQVTRCASNQPPYTCNKFFLSGITRCGCCGAPFRRHMNEYGVRWRCKDGCKQCPSVKEDELHRAVVQGFQRLPEMRESLIRIDERIQAGGIEIITKKLQNLEKRQDEIKLEIDQLVQDYQEGEQVDSIMSFKAELDELAIQYDELLTKRAELGVQRIQAISLLDLVDSIEGRTTLDMALARQCENGTPAACYDTEDFIRRTSKRYGPDALEHFNDAMTRRFVENVIVNENSITVQFKAGIEVTV